VPYDKVSSVTPNNNSTPDWKGHLIMEMITPEEIKAIFCWAIVVLLLCALISLLVKMANNDKRSKIITTVRRNFGYVNVKKGCDNAIGYYKEIANLVQEYSLDGDDGIPSLKTMFETALVAQRTSFQNSEEELKTCLAEITANSFKKPANAALLAAEQKSFADETLLLMKKYEAIRDRKDILQSRLHELEKLSPEPDLPKTV